MSPQDYKKIGRILKTAYAEIEKQAMVEGIDLLSSEYNAIIDKTRLAVLAKYGFTLEQYRTIKQEVAGVDKTSILQNKKTVEQQLAELTNRHIPTKEEIIQLAHEVAKQYIKPPVITNQIIKEKIIEQPKIIETIRNTIQKEVYNSKPLEKMIADVHARIDGIKPTPVYDDTKLKEYFHDYFSENFKNNINTLGMPDFRKLAMGLQDQIDTLTRLQSTITSGLLTATGTVNGSNITFTFTQKPAYIVSDGASYRENIGWTWSGLTATMIIPPNDDIFGFK